MHIIVIVHITLHVYVLVCKCTPTHILLHLLVVSIGLCSEHLFLLRPLFGADVTHI